MEIELRLEPQRSLAYVGLSASLDLLSVGTFQSVLEHKVGPAYRWVLLDLGHLQHIDSSGVGALIVWMKRLRAAGGDLLICEASPTLQRLFETLQLHQVFRIFPNRVAVEAELGAATTPSSPAPSSG